MTSQAVPVADKPKRAPRKQGLEALVDRIANLRIAERRHLAVKLHETYPDEFADLTKAMGEVKPKAAVKPV